MLKEFHTCDVSSATGVAQLMYIYIREPNDQARAYVAFCSSLTHACRGDMQARAHAKKKKKQTIDTFSVSFIVTYDTKDSSTAIRFEKAFAFLTFRWQKRIKSSVFILTFWGILGPGSSETHCKDPCH